MSVHKALGLTSLTFLLTVMLPGEAASDDGIRLAPAGIQTQSVEGVLSIRAERRSLALEAHIEELLSLVESLSEENESQDATIRLMRHGLASDAQVPSSKVLVYQRSSSAACGLGSFAGGSADVGWMRNRDSSDERRSSSRR